VKASGGGSGLGDPKRIGEALRNLRQAREVTQEDLAEATGIRRSSLSNYERGITRPNLESLDQLLQALGADLHDLANALQFAPIHRRICTGKAGPEDIEHAAFLKAQTAFREWFEALRGAGWESAHASGPRVKVD
jgi:transcriptional regulator with XRE-family HTH domain